MAISKPTSPIKYRCGGLLGLIMKRGKLGVPPEHADALKRVAFSASIHEDGSVSFGAYIEPGSGDFDYVQAQDKAIQNIVVTTAPVEQAPADGAA